MIEVGHIRRLVNLSDKNVEILFMLKSALNYDEVERELLQVESGDTELDRVLNWLISRKGSEALQELQQADAADDTVLVAEELEEEGYNCDIVVGSCQVITKVNDQKYRIDLLNKHWQYWVVKDYQWSYKKYTFYNVEQFLNTVLNNQRNSQRTYMN